MDWTKLRISGLTDVDLPIVNAQPNDEFVLKDVDGLGPTKVDVFIKNGRYKNRKPTPRFITARVGFNPNYAAGQTPSDLREYIYGLLTPGESDSLAVKIMNDEDVVCSTTGWVSTPETLIFTKDPQVQLTIDCVGPYLDGPAVIHPSLVGMSKSTPSFANLGTAPSGFEMALEFTANMSSWELRNASETRRFHLDYAFLIGDVLRFGTYENQKYVTLTRGVTEINLLKALSSDSVWFQLYGGVNLWHTSSSSFDWDDISYLPKFLGV